MKTSGTPLTRQGHAFLWQLGMTGLLAMTWVGIGTAQSTETPMQVGAGGQSAEAPTFKVLYAFKGGTDGFLPVGVILDAAGNLFGTTRGDGIAGHAGGNVYERKADGTFNVLYNFCSAEKCTDGNFPYGPLLLDTTGALYGTTEAGGTSAGTVFKLTP